MLGQTFLHFKVVTVFFLKKDIVTKVLVGFVYDHIFDLMLVLVFAGIVSSTKLEGCLW